MNDWQSSQALQAGHMQPNPYTPPAQQHAVDHPIEHHGGCESCGRWAPTKQVVILQNIGLLVMRFDRSIRGALCRRCISHHVWRSQLLNLLFGWWGVISFFFTLVALPANLVTYFGSRSMDDEYARQPGALY